MRVVLLAPIALWMAATYVAFVAGGVATFRGGWPERVPIPWSDLGDFVEAKNGDLYLDVAFYGRVVRYTRDGRFVTSYSAEGRSRHLAADVHGNVHWLAMNTVETRDPDWRLVQRARRDPREHRTWALDARGNAVHAPDLTPDASVADALVHPGQLLFRDGQRKRQTFTCADGTVLRRKGASLLRLAPDGRVIGRYAQPWYLWAVTFPWPAAVVGWGIPFIILLRQSAAKRRYRAGPSASERSRA
jgi:hypothetical protein